MRALGRVVSADGLPVSAQLLVGVAEDVKETLPLVRERGAQARPGHALHPQQGVTQGILSPLVVTRAEE